MNVPFGPHQLYYVWPSICPETLYFGTANKVSSNLALPLFKQFTYVSVFISVIGQGSHGPCTIDIEYGNHVCWWWGYVCCRYFCDSLSDPSQHVFMIGRATHSYLLPVMVVVTSAIGHKNHKTQGSSKASRAEQLFRISIRVVDQIFGFQVDEIQTFEKTNQMVFRRI